MANKPKYKVGDKIGLLTIVERGPNNGKTTQWYCDCECGTKHKLISSRRFSDKQRKKPCNCGCLNLQQISELSKIQTESLVGQKFGFLTVLEDTGKRSSRGAIIYKCQCGCGTLCEVRSTNLRNKHTQSCGCLKSAGELIISEILTKNNILFEKQKTFIDCKDSDTQHFLKFDFFINNTYLIEYDGIQHFVANGGWSSPENLALVQKRDKIKNEWCKKHNIPLIRINMPPDKITIQDLLLETSQYIYEVKGGKNEQ